MYSVCSLFGNGELVSRLVLVADLDSGEACNSRMMRSWKGCSLLISDIDLCVVCKTHVEAAQ